MFELTTPGSTATPDQNTSTDFTSGTDRIALSEKGFSLASSPDAATLFAASKTGGFTTAAQPTRRTASSSTTPAAAPRPPRVWRSPA
ncbi:MAG: hypothetical protein ACREET_11890 [Stellaceae bacterium]